MASIVDIICAQTDEQRAAAEVALAKQNAQAPSDLEVLGEFLRSCTTLDGKPLGLDDRGCVITLNG